jgi:hypothetical protein
MKGLDRNVNRACVLSGLNVPVLDNTQLSHPICDTVRWVLIEVSGADHATRAELHIGQILPIRRDYNINGYFVALSSSNRIQEITDVVVQLADWLWTKNV